MTARAELYGEHTCSDCRGLVLHGDAAGAPLCRRCERVVCPRCEVLERARRPLAHTCGTCGEACSCDLSPAECAEACHVVAFGEKAPRVLDYVEFAALVEAEGDARRALYEAAANWSVDARDLDAKKREQAYGALEAAAKAFSEAERELRLRKAEDERARARRSTP